MQKITELTSEQIALLPVYRDRWMSIGLSTERCDRAAAEESAIAAYKVAGLEPPKLFVWFESPLSLAIGDSVGASVWDSVGDSVRASVGDSVWASVRDSVEASVGDSVWASVWDSVRDSVRDSVGASVWASVWASVGDSVRAAIYGSQDAHWLGFYDYFLNVCGLQTCDRLQPLMDLAKNCGWWIPRQNICFLSEKPTICKLEDGVIHSIDGPAIAYADGFAVWAITGIRVDEQIVMRPETQTIEQIRSEQNEEIKRIRIERFGWQKYLEAIDAKVLDVSTNSQWMEALMSGDGMTVLTTYDPSTGRIYALEVDPKIKTCHDAQRYLLAPDDAFSRLGVNTSKIETYPVLRT